MRHQDAIKLWVRASDPSRWSTSLIVLLNFISICLCVCVPEKINHDMHAEVSMQGGSRISLSVCVSLSDVRKSGWSRRDLWLLPSYTKHCTVTVVFKSSKKTKNVTNKWVRSTVSDVKMSKYTVSVSAVKFMNRKFKRSFDFSVHCNFIYLQIMLIFNTKLFFCKSITHNCVLNKPQYYIWMRSHFKMWYLKTELWSSI